MASRPRVPSYVTRHIPLEINISSIPGAGRGMFAKADAKPGDLIFSVKNPYTCILSDQRLGDTCDGCLATINESIGTGSKRIGIFYCGGCKVVSFCDNGCFRPSWERYHKYECGVLATLGKLIGQGKPRYQGVDSLYFRTMLRVVSLHENGIFSTFEWNKYMSMKVNALALQNAYEQDLARDIASDLINFRVTSYMRPNQLTALHFRTQNNGCGIAVYPLKPCTSTDRQLNGGYLLLGSCIEPFYAAINHSCIANASWLFNGREFQLRAEKSIAKGDELFVSYIPNGANYEERSDQIKDWGFKCTCSLCLRGYIGPTGELGDRIKEILSNHKKWGQPEYEGQSPAIDAQNALRSIADIREAGFGNDSLEMLRLHHVVYDLQEWEKNTEEMLRTWLMVFLEIEPNQTHCQPRIKSLCALQTLAGLLDLEQLNKQNFDPYPDEVASLIPPLYQFVRGQIVKFLETFRGKESELTKWEHEKYMKDNEGSEEVTVEVFLEKLKELVVVLGVQSNLETVPIF